MPMVVRLVHKPSFTGLWMGVGCWQPHQLFYGLRYLVIVKKKGQSSHSAALSLMHVLSEVCSRHYAIHEAMNACLVLF
jgi:hypothetical protein